jgi:DNA-binding Xre family transcriptional regulator
MRPVKDHFMPPKPDLREKAQQKEAVLTQAVLRSADLLGVDRKDLSEIIGISEATISRMRRGDAVVSLESKEGKAAIQFARICTSLDSLFGGKPELCSKWLRTATTHLGGVPLDLPRSIRGLVDVASYLDAMRTKGSPKS